MTLPYTLVSQAVRVPAAAAYDFAHRMDNLPRWASGLAKGVHRDGDDWFAESPMGRVKVEMAPPNALGVLDHVVTLPDGTAVHNALRVTPCGDGALLVFVVLRQPGTSDADFEADAGHVRHDLDALRQLLERGAD